MMEPKQIILPDLKSETEFKSPISGVIRVKKFGDNIRAMVFGKDNPLSDIECYQSMYDVSNLETIFLPYINSMLTFLYYVDQLDNVLIIGLGGGQVPMLLSKKFNAKMDIVELDHAVINAAEHMGFVKSDKMNLNICDGADYLNLTMKLYDAIIIDLDKPDAFNEFNFLHAKWRLRENGILVVNCGQDINGKEILSDRLNEHFKSIKIFQCYGQYVYFCKINKYDFSEDRDTIYSLFNSFSNGDQILMESKTMEING